MVDDGDKGAEPVLKALKSLSTQLSSCQLGITLTALPSGVFCGAALARLRAVLVEAFVCDIPPLIYSVSLTLAMIVGTGLSMLIGGLVPKNLSLAKAMPVARLLARPQLIFTAIFRPIVAGLKNFSNLVPGLFGVVVTTTSCCARQHT